MITKNNLGLNKVNDLLRTIKPNIYSLGEAALVRDPIIGGQLDTISGVDLLNQSRVVAMNILGLTENYTKLPFSVF
jgi:hypothetical protein